MLLPRVVVQEVKADSAAAEPVAMDEGEDDEDDESEKKGGKEAKGKARTLNLSHPELHVGGGFLSLD